MPKQKPDKYWNEKQLLRDFGSGLNDVIGRGTLAGLVGGLGDIAGLGENGLRALVGKPQVEPWGGSEHIGRKMEKAGLVSPERRPKTELLASLVSPGAVLKTALNAPKTARNLLKALDNLEAPATMRNLSQRGAIDVWHGSPHKFDTFKAMDNIGGGEGAQAYGHGGYHASAPEVAMSYTPRDDAYEAKLMRLYDQAEKRNDYDAMSVYENYLLHKRPEDVIGLINDPTNGLSNAEKAKQLTAHKQAEKLWKSQETGNLYRNQLRWPDPAREAADPLSDKHFLDWDKPLSEQPYALEKLKGSDYLQEQLRAGGFRESDIDSGMFEGRHLVSAKRSGVADESGAMRELGIPGIRYLDGGSRSAGQGSHNYVTFDDALVNILERNGQPVGNLSKLVAPQDEALRVAQQNAALPVSEGGLGLRLDNTPEERASAMGFVREYPTSSKQKPEDMPLATFYHGTNKSIAEFQPKRIGNSNDEFLGDHNVERHGVFMAEDPNFSAEYARNDGKLGSNIMPLMYRSENPAYLNEESFYDDNYQKLIDAGFSREAINYTSKNPETIWPAFDDDERLVNALRGNGYDSVNMIEPWDGGAGGLADVRMVLDPSRIRSRFAAFDPMRKDSSDLLAGLAPLGLGALIAPREKKKKK